MTPSGPLVSPSFSWVPEYHKTYGPEVADLASMAGFTPDPEQALALDAMFAVDRFDRSVAFEVSVVCARQNLKTGLLKQAALGWLFVTEQNLIVWSAHEFAVAQEAFRDMTILIESCPDLDREVKAIHRGNGDEAIELLSGQRLKFKARTKGGGRGLTGDKVVLDEAMFLKPVHMGSLLPTLAAVDDPQVVMAGSAGLVDSAVQRATRDRGRAGGDPSLAYLEWCDPSPGGCATEDCDHRLGAVSCALDDRDRWRLANPAMGRRITEEYIASERRALPPEEFARERLGWWDEPAEAGTDLSPTSWALVADETVDVRSIPHPVLALDVSPSHASASIVAVGFDPVRALPVLELVERRPGASWLVERVAILKAQYGATVALNSSGPIGSLIPELTAAGVIYTDVRGGDYVKACGLLVASVNERGLRHHNDAEFTAAILGARARKNGDGFSFSRSDSSVDITPLVAAAVGLWSTAAAPAPSEPTVLFL